MSLINQMLQELDARGMPAAGAGILQGQIRAVPERRRMHPAWWVVLVLAIVLCVGAGWAWRVYTAPVAGSPARSARLPLKIDMDLSRVPLPLAAPPASVETEPVVAPVAAPASLPAVAALPEVGNTAASIPVAKADAGNPAVSMPAIKPAAPARPVQPSGIDLAATAAPSQPVVSGKPLAAADVVPALNKQVRQLTPHQHAENSYRSGASLAQQGKTGEAIAALEQAVQSDPLHAAARQTLVALLIESRRQDEAVRRLREGLQVDASQTGLAMILARLQIDRDELKPAIETLQRSLPHAVERADYHAFLAALLQRDARHKNAIEHYGQALRRTPQNGLWWMGLAISLQAENRKAEAIDAYGRARNGDGLSAELKAFVEEKLNKLQHQL